MLKNLFALNIVFISVIIILQKCLRVFCTIEVKLAELGACPQLEAITTGASTKVAPFVNGRNGMQPNGKCKMQQKKIPKPCWAV